MDPLEEVAKRLNTASNQLSIRIKQEEAELKAWNLGVSCWVSIDSYKLGYTNEVEGEWGLYIIQIQDGQEKQWRLDKAPRALRLYALPRIPILRGHLLNAAVTLTTRIEKFLETGEDDGLHK